MLGVFGRVYEPHGAGIHGVPIMLRNDEGFQKALRNIVSGESFRSELEIIRPEENQDNKKNAGRKPFDEVMMFKVLIFQRSNLRKQV